MQTPRKRRGSIIQPVTIVKKRVVPEEVKDYVKKAVANTEEMKQMVLAVEDSLTPTAGTARSFGYREIFLNTVSGTSDNQYIGSRLRLVSLDIDMSLTSSTSDDLLFQIAVVRLPYQLTSYSYSQLFKSSNVNPPFSGGVTSAQGYNNPWNKDFIAKTFNLKSMTINKGATTERGSKQYHYTVPINQYIDFQQTSTYEKRGSDIYVVWRATAPNLGAVSEGYFSAAVTLNFRDA